jgi:hypothetical protein
LFVLHAGTLPYKYQHVKGLFDDLEMDTFCVHFNTFEHNFNHCCSSPQNVKLNYVKLHLTHCLAFDRHLVGSTLL